MIEKYINSVEPKFLTEEIKSFADEQHTQAEILKYLIEKIVEKVNLYD